MMFFKKTGFTLLEVLVVLVIVSLISGLLFQGLLYVLHLRSQALVQLSDLQQGRLQEAWFRTTLEAIITDYEDGKNRFQGNSHEFSGLTMASLDNIIGVPVTFAWQIQNKDGRNTLRYRNSRGEYWDILSWSDERLAEFRYMAEDGEWHSQWPPPSGLKVIQLPSIILFSAKRHLFPITWIVKLPGYRFDRFKPVAD